MSLPVGLLPPKYSHHGASPMRSDGRHAQPVGQVARERIGVTAQEVDLVAHAQLRRREATRRQVGLEDLFGACRSSAASVERVDAGEVVEARPDLPGVREDEPARLQDGLHERDVAPHAFPPALVDEDLRERPDIVVQRGYARRRPSPRASTRTIVRAGRPSSSSHPSPACGWLPRPPARRARRRCRRPARAASRRQVPQTAVAYAAS